MRPKSDKENKVNSFTLWEDAHSHNVSVCGQYIIMRNIYQASLTGENALHVNYYTPKIFDLTNLNIQEIIISFRNACEELIPIRTCTGNTGELQEIRQAAFKFEIQLAILE
jgi:hypothetical protein